MERPRKLKQRVIPKAIVNELARVFVRNALVPSVKVELVSLYDPGEALISRQYISPMPPDAPLRQGIEFGFLVTYG